MEQLLFQDTERKFETMFVLSERAKSNRMKLNKIQEIRSLGNKIQTQVNRMRLFGTVMVLMKKKF